METITPKEILSRLESGEKLNLIDVREYDEVAEGMISTAQHIPMGEIPDRLSEIERNGEIILVCRSGNRSGRVYEYLESIGFTGLKNMTGGMLEWENMT